MRAERGHWPKILKKRLFVRIGEFHSGSKRATTSNQCPTPKFAELCRGLYCELRVRRALVYDSSVALVQTSGGLLNNHTSAVGLTFASVFPANVKLKTTLEGQGRGMPTAVRLVIEV